MSNLGRVVLFYWGILAIAAAMIALAVPALAIPSPCTVDISIDGTEFVAPVNSTHPAVAEMEGSYTSTGPAGARAVLSITGSVSTGWAISISPATVQMSGGAGGSGSFLVTVVVPAGSLHSDVGFVTIVARLTTAGIQCQDQASGITVTPGAYIDGIAWASVPRELNLSSSGSVFHLNLEIKANTEVTLTFEANPSGGISLYVPSSFQTSPPGDRPFNATVAVTVSAPTAPAGRYTANLTIRASAAGGLSQETPVAVPVNVLYGPEPVCAGCSQALMVGAGIAAAAALAAVVWWRWRR